MPLDTSTIPWIPLSPGFSYKPVRYLPDNAGRILLLRVEPGTVIPRHRHNGAVHGYTIRGQRKLLDTGAIVGPGGYVYEPPGNVDSWMAVGDEPMEALVTVHGDVEYLDDAGNVLSRTTDEPSRTSFEAWRKSTGFPALDLG